MHAVPDSHAFANALPPPLSPFESVIEIEEQLDDRMHEVGRATVYLLQ